MPKPREILLYLPWELTTEVEPWKEKRAALELLQQLYGVLQITATSNGSVNGMHDSLMPLSGLVALLNMQVNSWFGGVGLAL